MKTVKNIQKITKAMKMVATSKMKADLMRLQRGKNFGVNALDMIFTSDKYMTDRAPPAATEGEQLIVTLTSDKGMCGSINSGIIRGVRDYILETGRQRKTIFSIGDKGTVGMQRPFPDLLKVGISEIQTPYNYPTVMAITEHILKAS